MGYQSAFGIPIFTGSVNDQGLAESVVAFLRSEREKTPDNGKSYKTGYSNTGWHSVAWSDARAPKPVLRFRDRSTEILLSSLQVAFNESQMVYRYDGLKAQLDYVAWEVINQPGDLNFAHVHTSMSRDTWAMVYYPLVPTTMQGGELRLINPCMAFRTSIGTTLAQIGAKTMYMEFKPQSGDYILFPGWIEHDVRPYLGEGERFVLAANFSVRSLRVTRKSDKGESKTIHIQ